MTDNKFFRIIFFCLVILLATFITVYAQEPDEEEEPIVITPSGQLSLTLEQLGYDTRALNQDRLKRYYTLILPNNFQILPEGNYLDLITSHYPAIPSKDSFLQVTVNDHRFSDIALTEANAISNTLRLDLPEGALHTGYNSISIGLDTGATCREPAGKLDVLIDQTSNVSLSYQQNSYLTDLGLYPFPFVETSFLNIPVTIVLPDQPTSDELLAAMIVAADLGHASEGTIDLTVVLADNLTPDTQDNNHLIVIGKPETNDFLDDLTLPLSIDETILESEQGILQEIISPWNEFRLVLVVSGLDDKGILKASQALNRQAHFLGMRGPVAVILELGPLPTSITPTEFSFTLASLDYEDEVVYGTLPQDHVYRFTLPLGWQLEEPPFFVLKFAHADIISPESALDIKLNGTPIGSTLLDDSNAIEGELTVSLPTDRLKTGQNQLTVSIEMELSNIDDECDAIESQRAWTVIRSESEIFLPYSMSNLPPDLSLLPYPFSQTAGFDQVVFILPHSPSLETITQLIELAVRFGSANLTEQISPQVVYDSEINRDILQSHHLVLLGRPTQNSLLAEINPYLPHPFVAGSDLLETLAVDSVAFLADPDRDAGLLEIVESPWNEKYSILAVSGTTDEGGRLAVQALLEQPDQLKGNLAVVEPIFNPFSDDPNQISIYSVDTRSQVLIDQETSAITNTISEKDLSILANRWWK